VLVYAGIDEAGYGPLLGPLCIACSVFIVREADLAPTEPPDLWSILRYAVCRAGGDGNGRITVDDSKKVKGPNDGKQHPLKRLERGVLCFAHAGKCPESDQPLLEGLGVEVPPRGWYGSTTPLPVSHTIDELKIASSRLLRHLERGGVEFGGLMCEAIDAAEFNHQFQRMKSKAAVNFGAALRLVERVRRRYSRNHPHIVIDRQGGRTHYLEPLQIAWPEARIAILSESEALARYRLDFGHGESVTLTFLPEAESAHLPVALASMTAKYVRELMMLRLNRFFTAHLPELKPTAGYYGDGRRYLREVEHLLPRLGIDRDTFVRVC
jgi:ribonuclease HII